MEAFEEFQQHFNCRHTPAPIYDVAPEVFALLNSHMVDYAEAMLITPLDANDWKLVIKKGHALLALRAQVRAIDARNTYAPTFIRE